MSWKIWKLLKFLSMVIGNGWTGKATCNVEIVCLIWYDVPLIIAVRNLVEKWIKIKIVWCTKNIKKRQFLPLVLKISFSYSSKDKEKDIKINFCVR